MDRRGKPMAALISMRDLRRLEELESRSASVRERGLAALARARALRETILVERNGEPTPDSAGLIRQMREERTDALTRSTSR